MIMAAEGMGTTRLMATEGGRTTKRTMTMAPVLKGNKGRIDVINSWQACGCGGAGGIDTALGRHVHGSVAGRRWQAGRATVAVLGAGVVLTTIPSGRPGLLLAALADVGCD